MISRLQFGALALLSITLAWGPSPAAAHPDVDEAKELLMEAEFERALEAFARAEEGDDLTREDLIELLSARCLAHLALDDAAALRLDLRRLASLDREHRWGREAPPELGEAFADTLTVVDGELSVSSVATPVPGGVEVRGRAEGDHGRLVNEIRVFARSRSGSYRRANGGTQALPAGESLHYYVEAVGPGSAVLAREGSEDRPVTSEPALAGSSLIRRDDDDAGGVSPWLWVGIGAGVLVVVGIILAVVLGGSSSANGTQPQAPMVIGF
ncbi:MAG: hypothetical protein DRJ42_22055 [Deltaproteobacteria bacterium]|nr:MAG: hypothetical protein DRJ42_22055 [Deltaproteobacteria bacterium]